MPENNREVRTWGMLCHLASIAGFVVPFGHIFGPLIIWLIKKEEEPYIDAQGKESLNFQISITIYGVILLLLFFFASSLYVLLFWLAGGLYVTNGLLVILASVQANKGNFYSYPLTIRFLR